MSMCTMARSVPLAGGLGDGASPASLAASASMRACHNYHVLAQHEEHLATLSAWTQHCRAGNDIDCPACARLDKGQVHLLPSFDLHTNRDHALVGHPKRSLQKQHWQSKAAAARLPAADEM